MKYLITKNSDLQSPEHYSEASLDDLEGWLAGKTEVQVDTETKKRLSSYNSSDNPATAEILTIQLGDAEDQFVIDFKSYSLQELSCVEELFKDQKVCKLLWNAKYDIRFFFALGWKVNNIYDGFLAECVLTAGKEERSLSLGACALAYCGVTLNKAVRGVINHEGLSPRVILYASEDVRYLQDIKTKQLVKIQALELEKVLWLENEVVKVFAEMENEGLLLDKNEWLAVNKADLVQLQEYKAALNQIVKAEPLLSPLVNHVVQLSMFEECVESTVLINYDSPAQIAHVLRRLGIHAETTSEKDIEKYQDRHPFIKMFRRYKKQAKLCSTYGEGFLRYINSVTERVHTSYFQIVSTGRVSSGRKAKQRGDDEAPNMQNIPAKDFDDQPLNKYRNCFKPDTADDVFIAVDYSGQELALIADDSNEDTFITSLTNKDDLHSVVAELVYGEEWQKAADSGCNYAKTRQKCSCKGHKPLRNNIKTFNYAVSYQAGAKKIAATLNISVEEAERLYKMYFNTFSKLKVYFDSMKAYVRNNMLMRTYKPFRRIRFFEIAKGLYEEEQWRRMADIEREAINSRIQGSGADILKYAMVKLWQYREQHNYPVKFKLQVHDELICQTHKDKAEEWAEIQSRLMREASDEITKTVKIETDKTIATKWTK